MKLRSAVLLAILVLSVSLAAKSRDWQEGTVYKMGSASGGAAAMPVGTAMIALPITFLHYFVETADLKIELVTDRNLNLTLNKKTHIALEGNKAFLIDDDGKERRLRVVQKVAKVKDNL